MSNMEQNHQENGQKDHDALDELIVSRLGERQKKLRRMEEMEHQIHRTAPIMRTVTWATVMAVACLTAFLVVSPLFRSSVSPLDELGIEQPTLTAYRAAAEEMAEINRLMERGDYEQALTKTEKALRQSDLAIREIADMADAWPDDESMEYEERLERTNNSELRWTYIYLLVKSDRLKDARRELRRYLKAADYCAHETEAKALLEKI